MAVYLLLPWLIFLSACAKTMVIEEPVYPMPEEIDTGYFTERISYDALTSFSADIRVRAHSTDKLSGNFKGVMNYRKPGNLSSALFGPLGVTVMKALLSNGRLDLLVPNEDVIYRAPASLPLLFPDRSSLSKYSMYLEDRADQYILNVFTAQDMGTELVARYYFERSSLRNHIIEMFSNGDIIMSLNISKTGPKNIPASFSVHILEHRFDIEAVYIKVNDGVPDIAFIPLSASSVRPLSSVLLNSAFGR
ncbi:MAG: hypothetical protein JSV21_01460 [Nitrospirota bacterium]|nr:MAG: hypothetical protein JSV21_01460 [Nitrospirota bacterium]